MGCIISAVIQNISIRMIPNFTSFKFSNLLRAKFISKVNFSLGNFLFFVFLFFTLSVSLTQSASAEIPPPVLKCIEGDSLFWEIPEVTCGDLEGFVVYRSSQREGPYIVIDTINNPGSALYDAVNEFGRTFYYYMSSLADCPDDELLFSDTLSNLPLQQVPITSLSVLDNGVLVTWEKSNDPEISQYVIYRNTSQGTIPIDTVQDTLQYLDLAVSAEQKSEIYYVLSMNDCGSKSFFDQPHNTILLDFSIEECEQQINLEWNEYLNWEAGISSHILWVKTEDSLRAVDTISGNNFSTFYDQLIKDEEICIYITAENNALDASSKSNTICLSPDIVEPVRELEIFDLCFDENTRDLEIEWYWNETAEIESFDIRVKSSSTEEFATVYSENIQGNVVSNNLQNVTLPVNWEPPFEVVIVSRDICGDIRESSITMPVYLSGMNTVESNVLNWEMILHPNVQQVEATLEKTLLNGSQQIIDVSPFGNQSFEDRLSSNDPNEGRICYQLELSGLVELPNGEIVSWDCLSNTVCLAPEVKIYIPNAFKPRGVNQIFKPEFVFIESIVEYSLRVFDRWGEKVFESKNPTLGWDGQFHGEEADAGVFIYTVELRTEDGERIREEGTVQLFR